MNVSCIMLCACKQTVQSIACKHSCSMLLGPFVTVFSLPFSFVNGYMTDREMSGMLVAAEVQRRNREESASPGPSSLVPDSETENVWKCPVNS